MTGDHFPRRFAAPPPLVAIGAWVALILALHPLAQRFVSPATEDIMRYLLLGLGIPALGLWWALRWPGSARFDRSPLPALLAVVAVGASLAGIGTLGLPPAAFAAVAAAALALAVLQAALLAGFRHGWDRARDGVKPGVVAAGFAGWSAALAALPQITASPGLASLMPAGAVAAVGLTVLASWWGCGGRPQPAARAVTVLLDVLAAGLILALSFRTDGLFMSPGFADLPLAHHHWSIAVGPAMLVRDGGWLLWDVPSPYGLLSTLVLAAAPAVSVWQGLYLFNAALTATMFLAIYLVLRAVRSGLPAQAFSLLATAGLFFAIMDTGGVMHRHYYPTAGAFRFVWPFVLLGILAMERRAEAGSARQRRWLLVGCVTYTVAVVWSVESALYACAVWLPGYAIAVIRDRGWAVGVDAPGGRRWNLPRLAGWLLLPYILVGAAVAAVSAWYVVRLGHPPDWLAYVDYAIGYRLTSLPAALNWPVRVDLNGLYLPVIVAVLGTFAALAVVIRQAGWPRETGLLAGAAWMLWSWSSYVLARWDSAGLYMAMPALLVAIGVFLLQMNHRGLGWTRFSERAFRAVAVPLAALLALGVLSRPQLIGDTIAELRQQGAWNIADVGAGLPRFDPELAQLLASAGASPGDPAVVVTRPSSVVEDTPPLAAGPIAMPVSLTPAQPASLMGRLGPDRRRIYMERWEERHPRAGWVIQRKEQGEIALQYNEDTGPWFWEQLFRTHVPTGAWESEHWDVVWVEPAPAEQPRPALHDGRWMLDDRLIDSQIAGVLASWGPGALDKRGDGSATIADGTVLNLYSDKARTVRLVVEGKARPGYDLALDGAPAGTVDPANENRNAAELPLPAGWSQLVFTAASAGGGANPAVRSRVSAIRVEPPSAGESPGWREPARRRGGNQGKSALVGGRRGDPATPAPSLAGGPLSRTRESFAFPNAVAAAHVPAPVTVYSRGLAWAVGDRRSGRLWQACDRPAGGRWKPPWSVHG